MRIRLSHPAYVFRIKILNGDLGFGDSVIQNGLQILPFALFF